MLKDSDPELQRSFLTARERHQRGDLASAEAIYSRLLTLDPADSEVLFLFGHLQVTKQKQHLAVSRVKREQSAVDSLSAGQIAALMALPRSQKTPL